MVMSTLEKWAIKQHLTRWHTEKYDPLGGVGGYKILLTQTTI